MKGMIKFWAILFWILAWQLVSLAVGKNFLFSSPVKVAETLVSLLGTGAFYIAVASSILRIAAGFFIGLLFALVLAPLSAKYRAINQLLAPLVFVMKTVPIISFIILVLIWFKAKFVSVIIAAMIVFPIIYTNLYTGITSCDKKLLEVADVFKLGTRKKIRYIYFSEVLPHFKSGVSLALGIAWKAGVSAEVFGMPKFSIGENLYNAKIYLETEQLFAWTIVVILLSIAFEKLFMWLLERLTSERRPRLGTLSSPARGEGRTGFAATHYGDSDSHAPAGTLNVSNSDGSSHSDSLSGSRPSGSIRLLNVSKNFGEKEVLKDIDEEYELGSTNIMTGPSGCGKTTFINLLMGLEEPSSGSIVMPEGARLSAVFQEDRLLENMSAILNVAIYADSKKPDYKRAAALLSELELRGEEFTKVSELSGGMKRRVAIARAFIRDADIYFFDEALKGLDKELKDRVLCIIKERTRRKTVFWITHDRGEADKFSIS